MTLESILENLIHNNITPKDARKKLEEKDNMKLIRYFVFKDKISQEPLKDGELNQLNALVGILQILYNSQIGSPVSDDQYDALQEMLVAVGIPRLTGSVEINDLKKVDHQYTALRGSLHKIYYLFPEEKRTNPSRKYLHEWIKSMENKYEKNTGNKIDLEDQKVILTPKFDGASCTLEIGKKMVWLTRGDTGMNRASDVSHIMNVFNDVYRDSSNGGVKFEVMVTEENFEKINRLTRDKPYRSSRAIVTAVLSSNEPDFKSDYIYPIPLRIIHEGDKIEKIHPMLVEKFPTLICRLSERDKIKEFANKNKWVIVNGMKFRTDGLVITLINEKVQEALGRDNNINNFEVAYKFTEEYTYSKVRDIEFDIGEFGFITPALMINPVILKGNTVKRISLSNKERFDELALSYGDEVKILYDITPYATIDDMCKRVEKGRKIPFTRVCPSCRSELNLDVVQVQCHNKDCPARILGRILNYCGNLRIQNIGYSTLETLYKNGLLKNGIRSLYKLKKKLNDMMDLDGFGKLKARKIIAEIESKRRLKDYEFFGSIGIEGLSMKSFQIIFSQIRYEDFHNMMKTKNYSLLMTKLLLVDGIGPKKAEFLVEYIQNTANRIEIEKLIDELSVYSSFGEAKSSRGRIVFSGFRSEELKELLESRGYTVSDSWSNKTNYLVVKDPNEESTKITKAKEAGVPILTIDQLKVMIYKESQ